MVEAIEFNPPVHVAFPLDDDHEPLINVARFGDGYAQRMPQGLNHDLEKNTWTWENLSFEEYTAIWDFLKEREGWKPFLYAVPWGGTPVQKKYVAPKYSRSRPTAAAWNITCEVEEVVEA